MFYLLPLFTKLCTQPYRCTLHIIIISKHLLQLISLPLTCMFSLLYKELLTDTSALETQNKKSYWLGIGLPRLLAVPLLWLRVPPERLLWRQENLSGRTLDWDIL